jgi:hypothetical protein
MRSRSLPDIVMEPVYERWLEKLALALTRFQQDRTPENRAVYLRTLKTFANLAVRDEMPEDDQGQPQRVG